MTEPAVAATEPPARVHAGLARTAVTIAAVTIAARAVGVLRVFVQANAVGTGQVGDTYAAANQLPNIVFDVVAGGALASAVVPVLGGPVERGDRDRVAQTVSALLSWALLLLVPLALAGALLGRPLMELLVSGVDDPAMREAKADLGARMLLVFMPQIVLYGLGIVLTGVLQAHRRFVAPALAPLLSSTVVIGAYLLYANAGSARSIAELSRSQELLLTVGTTMGVAALTLPLLVPLGRLRLGLRPTLRMPPGVGRQLRGLALAGGVALGAQQLAALVVLWLAQPVEGATVVFQLAWTVFLVPWAVAAVPIATSAFPTLTAAADSDDRARYADTHAAALRGLLVACLLSAAVVAAAARPAAHVLLALVPAGLGGDSAEQLARALAAFAPGVVGYGALALLTRACYARHDGRSPAVATAAGFAIAVVLDVVLAAALPAGWRIAGVGAGHTVGMTVAAAALLVGVRRAAGPASTARVGRTLACGGGAAVVAAGAGAVAARAVGVASAAAAVGGLLAAVAVAVAGFAATLAVLGGGDLRASVLRRRGFGHANG